MFVYTTNKVDVTQRVVATLVACAVVMGSIGFYTTAQAANLTTVSNTLSTSEPTEASAHTISFVAVNDIATTENITITWDSQRADGTAAQDFGGINTITDATDLTFAINGGASSAPTHVSQDANSIEVNGIVATAGQTVEIVVAEAAGIINPTTLGSYEIEVAVANTEEDLGRTRVVILDTVEVTAIVPTIFEFVVSPVDVGETINGEATTGSSSTTTIPFGVLEAGTPGFIAQQLNVTTNAFNGFVVTVEQDLPLTSSTGADIDSFFDNTDETTPTAWDSPDGTLAFGENGWGHWGMTTEDGDVFSAGAPDFTGADEYIAVLDTPQVIFGHNGPSDGVTTGAGEADTDDIGQTEVGYKIEITPLQEAGDDYNTTLTYIATSRF